MSKTNVEGINRTKVATTAEITTSPTIIPTKQAKKRKMYPINKNQWTTARKPDKRAIGPTIFNPFVLHSKSYQTQSACESMTCCILNGINGAQEKMKFLIPAPTASHLQAITIAWHIRDSCQ